MGRLWRPFRTRGRGGYAVPLLPLQPPQEPEACLQSMLGMARLLIEVRRGCCKGLVVAARRHLAVATEFEGLYLGAGGQTALVSCALGGRPLLQTDGCAWCRGSPCSSGSFTLPPPLSPLPSQDLGADAFHHLVAKVPWVLLLDGDTHG